MIKLQYWPSLFYFGVGNFCNCIFFYEQYLQNHTCYWVCKLQYLLNLFTVIFSTALTLVLVVAQEKPTSKLTQSLHILQKVDIFDTLSMIKNSHDMSVKYQHYIQKKRQKYMAFNKRWLSAWSHFHLNICITCIWQLHDKMYKYKMHFKWKLFGTNKYRTREAKWTSLLPHVIEKVWKKMDFCDVSIISKPGSRHPWTKTVSGFYLMGPDKAVKMLICFQSVL